MHSMVLLMWLALCSEQDVRERQISEYLTLGVGACALLWLFATGHSWLGAEASDAGWGLAIVMLLTLPGYWLAQLGASDVKLLATLAVASSHEYVLGTFIGAGVCVVVWLLFRRRLLGLLNPKIKKRLQAVAERMNERQPFAPYVLVGFVLASVWIQ